MYSVSGYQTAFADRELNSIAGTISFVGAASESPSNWELSGGSVGELSASDGLDCGVNVATLLTVE